MKNYDVCVLGLGYIGVPTSVIFAHCGKFVLGVDIFQERVDKINLGISHVGEADIDTMLKDVVRSGNLKAATVPKSSNAYIIAVPTPFIALGNGRKLPDLSYVERATRSLARCIENGQLVILESTSPVGTTRKIRGWLKDELNQNGRNISVDIETIMFAHCPERILPGQMLRELVSNDRIVGGMTEEASQKAKELYGIFCQGEIYITDDKTAEMAKLTENASRDVSIAFANELSIVCDKFGINVWELIRLANRHPRVNILSPGPGVGGHCIAVDPWFIIAADEDETPLMRTAREVNDGKPLWIIDKIFKECENISGRIPVVACLGVSYKANVNDIRESPSLKIAELLAQSGKCKLLISDPHVESLPEPLKSKSALVEVKDAVADADIVLLLVEHREFSGITSKSLEGKVLIDTKGFLRE